jgi:hypothetical protein
VALDKSEGWGFSWIIISSINLPWRIELVGLERRVYPEPAEGNSRRRKTRNGSEAFLRNSNLELPTSRNWWAWGKSNSRHAG